jgi:molybdopterin converting factor small subunit|tara:strand:- start:16 stop:261 length:246 start_codon:yes stop_codon:yes gene_type:complete
MKYQVKMFAAARQLAGQAVIEVSLDEPATVADLRHAMLIQFPGLQPLANHLLLAIDTEYADDDRCLDVDSEIAVIPPVSGG